MVRVYMVSLLQISEEIRVQIVLVGYFLVQVVAEPRVPMGAGVRVVNLVILLPLYQNMVQAVEEEALLQIKTVVGHVVDMLVFVFGEDTLLKQFELKRRKYGKFEYRKSC